MRRESGAIAKVVSTLAIAIILFQLLYISHVFDRFQIYIGSMVYASVSLGIFLPLIFIRTPIRKKALQSKLP